MNNLAIVQLPLASLHPYAHNPRKNDEAVPRMVEVLQEFGFRVPILAKSDGEIIDGHLRYKAAQAIDLAEVPALWKLLLPMWMCRLSGLAGCFQMWP